MSVKEFWEDDPILYAVYVEAYLMKLKREEEMRSHMIDYEAWLTGSYVYRAVGVVLGNAFSKGAKGQYPSEPISITHEKRKKRKEESENALLAQFAGFQQLVNNVNKGKR